ncbi:transketolase [Candidatus Roizmanbacteria bacterium]|nr:transketolase [Candidatus Roizmanbacteria bacterium]
MANIPHLSQLSQILRHDILTSTTAAKSGHPTSSLSAVELMATLFFGGFLRQDINDFKRIENDRVIFSKGHASPLLYALYHVAGVLKYDELLTLRKFGSRLQGHSTPDLPFVDVATGSLGQGLSIGVGMALGIKTKFQISNFKFQIPKVFVLLGDSELAEGQNWEAAQIASYNKLDNIIAIVDVNRLGQRGETMLEWDLKTYEKRFQAFGWNTIVVKDGHNIKQISNAFHTVETCHGMSLQKPTVIISKTVKGKGVPFLEDKPGWHGKPVPKEQLEEALRELGSVDLSLKGKISSPKFKLPVSSITQPSLPLRPYPRTSLYSTREVFGDALVDVGCENNQMVALDAEVGNSTYTEKFGKKFPERFFQCYIEEQHMASSALGFAKVGYIPYISSFAAFLTRAFDQIRMAQYSLSTTMNIVGSHCGVSIGEDGASQMGLEDIAMMRAVRESTVLYPSDAVSVYKLTKAMATHPGMNYLRTTREKTPVIYDENEEFPIGGCKVHGMDSRLRGNDKQKCKAIIIGAGITVHVALKAQQILAKKGVFVTVVDLYSVKPIDAETLQKLVKNTPHVIVAEDHYEFGGVGEAVLSAFSKFQISNFKFTHLCVRKLPRSGTPHELLHFEHLDEESMVKAVME